MFPAQAIDGVLTSTDSCNWSVLQLFVISLVAGISEEAFFRGAIQGSLADRVGMSLALVLASMLFGAAHLITWTYQPVDLVSF